MRVVGARAYRHVPKQRRRKLEPVSERCVFVGYEPDSKAYRVLRESDGKIMISRDVISDEGEGDNGVVELSSDPSEGSPKAADERDIAPATAPAPAHAPVTDRGRIARTSSKTDESGQVSKTVRESRGEPEEIAKDTGMPTPAAQRYPALERLASEE